VHDGAIFFRIKIGESWGKGRFNFTKLNLSEATNFGMERFLLQVSRKGNRSLILCGLPNLGNPRFSNASLPSSSENSRFPTLSRPVAAKIYVFVRLPGIEPGSRPWQGRVLPLNHSRKYCAFHSIIKQINEQ
jgi:hypothetical protein